MSGFGEATAYGAATIVNAIAIGRGAAFGIDLKTTAKVELNNDVGVVVGKISSEQIESIKLIEESVKVVLKHFKVDTKYGAAAETNSNIPIARGLKSSSVAANALILATAEALGETLDDQTALALSVQSAFKAGTTVTGAYDDACASYYGNIVVADNLKRQILKREKLPDGFRVAIYVPEKKAYTIQSDVERMKLIARQVELAFREALSGNYWNALTLNGILYTSVLGYDPKPIIDSLAAGAVASGLSGKGPAIVAITPKVEDVLDVWKPFKGQMLNVGFNGKRAFSIRRE